MVVVVVVVVVGVVVVAVVVDPLLLDLRFDESSVFSRCRIGFERLRRRDPRQKSRVPSSSFVPILDEPIGGSNDDDAWKARAVRRHSP